MKEGSFVPGLLLVAFVVLKLCGVIFWSWIWVLSPIWIPLVLVAIAFVGLFIYGKGGAIYYKKFKPEKWEKMQDIAKRRNEPKLSKWEQRLAEMKNRSK